MSDYGVTDKGFVLKRADRIMEEIHTDLTEGFGVDTRLSPSASFLNVLVTTFTGQIASLWETAQESYYAKYPASAEGVNLENAVQYGGIRRAPAKKSCYPLHCSGDDGAVVPAGTQVGTATSPQITLTSSEEFEITRSKCNGVRIAVASIENNSVYFVSINGVQYKYESKIDSKLDILQGLAEAMKGSEYETYVNMEIGYLTITDTVKYRSNQIEMSNNLTTEEVTTIANFYTDKYGKIMLPYNIVTVKINDVSGFSGVKNILEPIYGRDRETDIELRQSYIAKSALRSNTMIESITADLINNVDSVVSASGYENCTDAVDERGLPPHSIEIIVEGGDETQIAETILRRKAGGIQTYGSVEIDVPGAYGDVVPIKFNRPEFLYAWIKIVLHGDKAKMPTNYASLVKESLVEDGSQLKSGSDLYIQLLNEGIYNSVSGISFVDASTAYSTDPNYKPDPGDYKPGNIVANMRQKILIDENRIEVTFDADS